MNKIDVLAVMEDAMTATRGQIHTTNQRTGAIHSQELREAASAVAGLIEAMRKIEAELATTVLQLAPSDDQIIADHVRNSARVATAALAKVTP